MQCKRLGAHRHQAPGKQSLLLGCQSADGLTCTAGGWALIVTRRQASSHCCWGSQQLHDTELDSV